MKTSTNVHIRTLDNQGIVKNRQIPAKDKDALVLFHLLYRPTEALLINGLCVTRGFGIPYTTIDRHVEELQELESV